MKNNKYLSKTGKMLFIPILISGGILMVFEKELINFQFIIPLKWLILLGAFIVVFAGLIDLFNKK